MARTTKMTLMMVMARYKCDVTPLKMKYISTVLVHCLYIVTSGPFLTGASARLVVLILAWHRSYQADGMLAPTSPGRCQCGSSRAKHTATDPRLSRFVDERSTRAALARLTPPRSTKTCATSEMYISRPFPHQFPAHAYNDLKMPNSPGRPLLFPYLAVRFFAPTGLPGPYITDTCKDRQP